MAWLQSPSLQTTVRRRWWLLITAVLENVFFSQLLFGWAALLLMLKSEGFFSDLCEGQNATQSNSSHSINDSTSSVRHLLSTGGSLDSVDGCSAQDGILNIAYALSLFSQTGSGFVIGALQDRFGYKKVRLGGSILFTATHVCLVFINSKSSMWLIPFFVIGALAGNVLFLTSLQVANLFGHRRGLITGALVGGMTTSAIMFSIYKNLYDVGMSMQVMWAIIAAGGVWILGNTLLTWPQGTIPVPGELESTIVTNRVADLQKTEETEKLQAVGKRMSTSETYEVHKTLKSSSDDLSPDSSDGFDNMTFLQALRTGLFLLGTLVGIIFCLRLLLYIGIMFLSLKKLTDTKTMTRYVEIFGYLQVLSFVPCVLLNWLLDRGTNPDDIKTDDETEKNFQIRVRRLNNSTLVFNINAIVLLLFGVFALIPVLEVQILTFLTHTLLRGSFMSAVLGSYAVVFPFRILGKIAGLTIFLASLADLVQSPIFILITKVLNNDPFWVDIGLLVFSLLNFLLPLNLYLLTKKMQREHDKKKPNYLTNIVKSMAENGDAVAKKLLPSLQEKENIP